MADLAKLVDELSSLTVLEAWACGLPAVTTRLNGAAELMRDGAEGFVLKTAPAEALLAAIRGRARSA